MKSYAKTVEVLLSLALISPVFSQTKSLTQEPKKHEYILDLDIDSKNRAEVLKAEQEMKKKGFDVRIIEYKEKGKPAYYLYTASELPSDEYDAFFRKERKKTSYPFGVPFDKWRFDKNRTPEAEEERRKEKEAEQRWQQEREKRRQISADKEEVRAVSMSYLEAMLNEDAKKVASFFPDEFYDIRLKKKINLKEEHSQLTASLEEEFKEKNYENYKIEGLIKKMFLQSYDEFVNDYSERPETQEQLRKGDIEVIIFPKDKAFPGGNLLLFFRKVRGKWKIAAAKSY